MGYDYEKIFDFPCNVMPDCNLQREAVNDPVERKLQRAVADNQRFL